jgi:hypothetical protein
MRRVLTAILELIFGTEQKKKGRPARPPKRPTHRPGTGRPGTGRPGTDVVVGDVIIEYTPSLDGDPDPGEVVWTWVPYEDDPSQGKDRPVVIVGRRGSGLAGSGLAGSGLAGSGLVGVALTSKQHDREPQVEVGTGPWDREGRTSYAKLERLLAVDPKQVRREGAVLGKRRFDEVIAGLEQLHGPLGPRRV